jgi:hypothetical protein
MMHPRAENVDDDLHTWRVSQNIIQNQSWKADKRSFSTFGVST